MVHIGCQIETHGACKGPADSPATELPSPLRWPTCSSPCCSGDCGPAGLVGAEGWCRLSTPACMHAEGFCRMFCTTGISLHVTARCALSVAAPTHACLGKAGCNRKGKQVLRVGSSSAITGCEECVPGCLPAAPLGLPLGWQRLRWVELCVSSGQTSAWDPASGGVPNQQTASWQ